MTLMMDLKQQRREGYAEGRIENMLKSVKSLMTKRGWILGETMEALGRYIAGGHGYHSG